MGAWYDYPISHGYITNYQGPGTDTPHYAVDLAAPFHTPFAFPDAGTIKQADYAVWSGQPGGGEVFLQPDKGGPEEYVYHLDEIDTSVGQHVQANQQVGLSGGQNSGGEHNTSPMWSSGAHIHFGYFQNYANTPAGSRPYGPDPTGLVNQLKGGAVTPLNSYSNGIGLLPGTQTGSACTAPSGIGWLNPVAAGQYVACQAGAGATSGFLSGVNWSEILIRGGLILGGGLLVALGLWGLAKGKTVINVTDQPGPQVNHIVKNDQEIAPPPPGATA